MTSSPADRRPPLTLTWSAKYLLHVVALGAAFLIAYELRRALPLDWWLSHPDARRVIGWAILYAVIGGGVEAVFQTERTAWRFVSLREVLTISRNVVVGTGLFALVIFTIDRGFHVPRSVLPLAAFFSIAALCGLRLTWRFIHDPTILRAVVPYPQPAPTVAQRPLLIIGAMADADSQVRQILGDRVYQVIGIISPNAGEVGLRLHDILVIQRLDPGALAPWLAAQPRPIRARPAILFLGDPVADFGLTVEQIGDLRSQGHVLLRPQSLVELGSSANRERALREIPVEEFLGRTAVKLDPTPVQTLVQGRRVLVTGAGGSIGSEICRQVAAFGCGRLSLLDHSEFGLFKIDQEIAAIHPTLDRREIICDVRDYDRILACIEAEAPDIIFHAAALKHVPIVEKHPTEGVLTNVIGTFHVAEAAHKAGVAQMVMISTDKAVDPSNVMGATKRLAEGVVRGLSGRSRTTTFSVVRFGNVLGSAGSVAPIFEEQIRRGGPVTVTHPDVERYFMTIPEAVQLVLHATAESASRGPSLPSVFVLDMGQPVKILDMARSMISLHGLTPETDIPIVFTGLRPGEKLTEELVDSSETVVAKLQSVTEVNDVRAGGVMAEAEVRELEVLARSGDKTGTRQAIYDHVSRLRGSASCSTTN